MTWRSGKTSSFEPGAEPGAELFDALVGVSVLGCVGHDILYEDDMGIAKYVHTGGDPCPRVFGGKYCEST